MSQLFHSNPLQPETELSTHLASPEQEAFWRQQLTGLNRSASLHLTGSNRPTPETRTIAESAPLSRSDSREGGGLLPETVLVASWACVLASYHQEQQAFFALRFDDPEAKSDHLWPIMISLPDQASTSQWLSELDTTLRGLKEQEPITLLDLHLWFEVPANEHIVESMIDFSDSDDTELPVPLQIQCKQPGAALLVSRLMPLDALKRLSRQFSQAHKSIVETPGLKVSEIEILSPSERKQVLEDWNNTKKRYPAFRNLKELVEAQVARTPDGIAVELSASSYGTAARLTYRELNSRANQVAHRLQKLGIGPDSIVGISAERSIELAIGVLGIIKAGAAYVPFDPNYPKDRLEFMIADTQAPVILTQKSLKEKLPATTAEIICLDSDWEVFASENTLNPNIRTNPEHLAYLIYTSGSTGKPKGVSMRQGPLINLLLWQLENFSFTPVARTLQFASINFDVSFQELFSTWCSGGTLVLISEAERRDSRVLVHFVQENRIERMFLPFVALKHFAEAAESEGLFPERLREVITAGEQLQITPQLLTLFRKLPKCTLENQYGPSETHVVTAHRLRGTPETWPTLPTIGKPIANTLVFILNSRLKPVPIGVPGELYLGGDCLARGYLNRPELTAERFIRNPLSEDAGSRLYKTGDLARFLPDGNIEFLGRIDHQVKIRGFRIELGEIEALLCKHTSVREAAAMARDSASGEKQLVAYVTPANGSIDTKELRSYLQARVPPYAVPASFVVLPKLPLSPNGKVDRKALPAPTETEAELTAEEVLLPRDPLEMQIKLVFEKFLNRRNIGIDVSFFEIGGDSLQALKLVLELERVTGKKIPLSILYQASTIQALANVIRDRSADASFSSLVPLQPLGTKPPLYLIHTTPGDVLGYGNLIYHLPDQPCYGLQSLGLDREELAHKTVPEMAAYYVKLIREKQPEGPYYLGGWCYGGIIAVEMAHQFLAAGQKIGPLVLIETPAPAPSFKMPFYFLRRIGCALNMTPRQWKNYIQAKIRYYRGVRTQHEKRYQRVETQEGQSPEEIERHNRFLARLEYLYHVNLSALNGYKSKFFPGKIVLFNAADQDPAVIHDPLYGWLGLARDIQAHVIPGDHDTILMEPHVPVLAKKLAQCLHGK